MTDPYIPEAHGVAVILQYNWALWWMGRLVVCDPLVFNGPDELLAVVQEHAVMDDGHIGLLGQLAAIPSGGFKNDVVALPDPWGLGGITQGRELAVHCPDLSVGIGLVLEGVENLHLILAVNDNAGVPTALAVADRLPGGGKLEVELEIAELFLGLDGAGFWRHLHVAVFNLPSDRFAGLLVLELGEVGAVEQDNGIGGRGCAVAEGFTCCDNLGSRTVVIMDTPFAVRQEGCVSVAGDVLLFSGLREGSGGEDCAEEEGLDYFHDWVCGICETKVLGQA